ncbi:MAG TPA: hypothetical protein VGZ03_11565 [Acidimicrobiales bacterium]|nr:hypothetical protein [Acidimicrobiales bacterium]
MIFLSSFELYVSDVALCAFLVVGLGWLFRRWLSPLLSSLTWPEVRRFVVWEFAVCLLALVGFKALVLASFEHAEASQALTGKHGSLQFSATAEVVGALCVVVGALRCGRWLWRWARGRREEAG